MNQGLARLTGIVKTCASAQQSMLGESAVTVIGQSLATVIGRVCHRLSGPSRIAPREHERISPNAERRKVYELAVPRLLARPASFDFESLRDAREPQKDGRRRR
jgi:hypothetical protein